MKRAEDALASVAQLAQRALEASDVPLILLSSDQRVLAWSAGAARLLGPCEGAGPMTKRVEGSSREAWDKLVELAGRTGLVRRAKISFLDADARAREALTTIRSVGEPGAKPEGFVVSLEPWVDGTAPSPEALFETFRRLEQLSLAGQLASSFAHEIKSPLHVILSTSELLLDTPGLDDAVRDNVGMMARNAHRAAATAKALMDLASHKTDLAPGSLTDLVERTLELLEMRLKSRRIVLARDIRPSPPILMDPHLLQGVVFNLVTNAADAMPHGGRLSVRVRGSADGREVTLEVQDAGAGIDPEVLPRIGEPFFTTKLDGTGMGLFLSKRTVLEHRGRIEFASEPGRGTAVTITFPGL